MRPGGLESLGSEIEHSSLPEDLDIETVGGFIFTNIGRLPLEGESIIRGNIRLTVLKIENNRVTKIKVERVEN